MEIIEREALQDDVFELSNNEASPAGENRGILEALGYCRDSGYVPSPSSARSFRFSSLSGDEEEVNPSVGRLTRPIAIPSERSSAYQDRLDEEDEDSSRWAPVSRPRTRSCPEDTPRLPLLRPRYPHLQALSHGRNWSTPVTSPDGAPVLTTPVSILRPPMLSRGQRHSRDTLIDLAADQTRRGPRRRVLVANLPDLLIGAEERDPPSEDPPPSPSELRSDRQSRGGASSRATALRRPAWIRPRALSCDVTLEVEMGQELRRIADSFHSLRAESPPVNEVGVWGRLRCSFRRQFPPRVSPPDSS